MSAKNKDKKTPQIRVGTSSFSSKDWVGPFYPEGMQPGDFLEFYSKQFDTVEVDVTYYRVPTKTMVDAWKAETPSDFLLSAKFPRSIVHAGEGATPDSDTVLDPKKTYKDRDDFLEAMSRLGKRLGTLVLQFPYFSKKHFSKAGQFLEKLDRFLDDLPEGFKYGVEVRNRSWIKAELADLLRSHGTVLVLADQAWMPHGDEVEKKFDIVTSDHIYIRLIGDRSKVEAITTTFNTEVIDRSERIERWADLLARMYRRQISSLIYVNNHYAGFAPGTAQTLREKIQAAIK
jgi:uncharacterized protein YecE (DUF72 family)